MKGSKRSGECKDAFRYWWRTAETSCRAIFGDVEVSRLYSVFRAGWVAHRHQERYGTQEPTGLMGDECIDGDRNHDWENTVSMKGRGACQPIRVCRRCYRIEPRGPKRDAVESGVLRKEGP